MCPLTVSPPPECSLCPGLQKDLLNTDFLAIYNGEIVHWLDLWFLKPLYIATVSLSQCKRSRAGIIFP